MTRHCGNAVKRLKKQRDFRIHLLMYILINGLLVVIWAMTDAGFLWPEFPIAGSSYGQRARFPIGGGPKQVATAPISGYGSASCWRSARALLTSPVVWSCLI